MKADSSQPPDQQLLFEQTPQPWVCVLFAIGAAACGVLFYKLLPPSTSREYLELFGLVLLAVLFVAGAVVTFKTADDAVKFFADHAEFHRRRKLIHRLDYKDMEQVAYGIQASGRSEFLTLAGAGGKSRITYAGVGSRELRQLRDQLYDMIAQRMFGKIAAGGRAAWFGPVEIAAGGLHVDGTLIPWNWVKLAADDSIGVLQVSTSTRSWKASMIDWNVVPGLILAKQLQSRFEKAKATQPSPRS